MLYDELGSIKLPTAWINEIRSDLEGRHRVSPCGERSHQPQSDGGFAGPAVGAGDDDTFDDDLL